VSGVDGILFSETLASEGAVVFAKAFALGVVVRRVEANGAYQCGPSRFWFKTRTADFVRT
jgi:hypothetical protein